MFVMDLRMMIDERGLKYSWVADRLDIRKPQFTAILQGRIPLPPEKVGPLARALRVKRRDLVTALTNGHASRPPSSLVKIGDRATDNERPGRGAYTVNSIADGRAVLVNASGDWARVALKRIFSDSKPRRSGWSLLRDGAP